MEVPNVHTNASCIVHFSTALCAHHLCTPIRTPSRSLLHTRVPCLTVCSLLQRQFLPLFHIWTFSSLVFACGLPMCFPLHATLVFSSDTSLLYLAHASLCTLYSPRELWSYLINSTLCFHLLDVFGIHLHLTFCRFLP
jgi:hypothetical protein